MIELTVNGEALTLEVDPATPLLLVLRNCLGLTGAKLGCGLEQCGACAVLVDGVSTLSCARPVNEFAGKSVTTVEGIGREGHGHRVQQALVAHRAAQCGYCTPGIVVALCALFDRNPQPGDAEVRAALNGHLCRCGSHNRVLAAAADVAGRAP